MICSDAQVTTYRHNLADQEGILTRAAFGLRNGVSVRSPVENASELWAAICPVARRMELAPRYRGRIFMRSNSNLERNGASGMLHIALTHRCVSEAA